MPPIDWDRPLTEAEAATVRAAREGAHLRYEGKTVPHRSCGVAIAETFGRPLPAYHSLRKGGLTGRGECGTAVAGRLVLGELLGDPLGPPTPAVVEATLAYEAHWDARCGVDGDRACHRLMAPFPDFQGPARAARCTSLAAETAALVAEVLVRAGHPVPLSPLPAPPR